jgi:hypothetical protein
MGTGGKSGQNGHKQNKQGGTDSGHKTSSCYLFPSCVTIEVQVNRVNPCDRKYRKQGGFAGSRKSSLPQKKLPSPYRKFPAGR